MNSKISHCDSAALGFHAIFHILEKKDALSSQHDVLTEVKLIANVYTIFFYSKASRSHSRFSQSCKHALGHAFGHKHTDLYGIMSPILRSDVNSKFLSGKLSTESDEKITYIDQTLDEVSAESRS